MLTPYRKDDDFPKKPFDFWDFRRSLDKFFNETFLPAFFHDFGVIRADIRETDKEYIVEAEIPGIDKDRIDVFYHDDVLTISASYEEGQDIREGNFIQKERRSGKFSRSFYVENVDENKITADYSKGILRVVLPKSDKPRTRGKRIEIQ